LQGARGANGFLDRPFHVGIRHKRKAVSKMLAHRLQALDVGCEIGSTDLHLDGAKALGEIAVRLLQKRLHRELEVDAAGVTGNPSVEAAEQTKQRHTGTARLQVPQGDIERRQREHGRAAAAAVVQGPPDVMPDGFSVIRFAALDQLGNFPPERIGNRAAIAADSVSIANTFGPVGIADTASYQFEGVDFAVRAVRETKGQRDRVESGLDCLDNCSAGTVGQVYPTTEAVGR
jgi:hypothetical protein